MTDKESTLLRSIESEASARSDQTGLLKAGVPGLDDVRGGFIVFPRTVASEHQGDLQIEQLSSGVQALDDMFGGGIDRGTSTLLLGAPGTGKSSLAIQYAVAAAQRDEKSAQFIFNEVIGTLRARAQGMGMQMSAPMDASYLADMVVILRPFEKGGEIHRAISAVKKRVGLHERSTRSFRMSAQGLELGPPLRGLRGIFTGAPEDAGVPVNDPMIAFPI